ncbi:unnamed protein product, partial [marine sediment metagenome]
MVSSGNGSVDSYLSISYSLSLSVSIPHMVWRTIANSSMVGRSKGGVVSSSNGSV